MSSGRHRSTKSREVEGKELATNGRSVNSKRLEKRLGRSEFKTEDGRTRAALASPSPSTSKPGPAWDQTADTPPPTAVRCRDLASVQSLLDFGAPISLDRDSRHYRPFIMAINQGYTLILRALLAASQRPAFGSSVTPDQHTRGYNALLRRTVNSLSLESTKCLIECGAGLSSIQGIACFDKMEEPRRKKAMLLVMALVEKGANIDGFDEEDGTEPFLCTAIRCENFAMVSFLLRRGANPTWFPPTGMSSPIHLIMRARDPIFGGEALEALVSHGADIDAHESVSNVHVPIGYDVSDKAMLLDLIDGQRPYKRPVSTTKRGFSRH
jgi:ankyrin repeat protein